MTFRAICGLRSCRAPFFSDHGRARLRDDFHGAVGRRAAVEIAFHRGLRAFLWAVTASAPAASSRFEAGWCVTELGRQPWINSGRYANRRPVTPMPGLIVPFLAITLLYLLLAV